MKKIFFICIVIGLSTQIQAQEDDGSSSPVPTEGASMGSTTDGLPTADNANIKLQKPLTRAKTPNPGLPNESSSFVPDPDNLDILNPNRENIKGDEEPILEDIKQVLDAPKIQEQKSPPPQEILKEAEISSDQPSKQKQVGEEDLVKKQVIRKKTQGALKVKSKKTNLEKISKKKSKKTSTESSTEIPMEIRTETPNYRTDHQNLQPDDPDLQLEKKFNAEYRAYNINPTSIDAWEAATAKQQMREYVVQKGDTLWSISQILFGDPTFWPKIWALNKQGILNPHFILPNSKIYFYMGDVESAPTLSVGEKAKIKGVADLGTGARDEEEDEVSESGADAAATKSAVGGQKANAYASAPIPDSLPLYRSEAYFNTKVKEEIKVDFGEIPRFPYENVNEIYITDKPIKTQVLIDLTETAKFRCYDGRILSDIKYTDELFEEYDIFEPLENFETSVGKMYSYRFYGKAQPYKQDNLKLSGCSGIIATSLVLISKGTIQELRSNRTSAVEEPVLIGGIDVKDQKLFITNQLAYVDFGSYGFETGQVYKTMSKLTDEINGHIKIIEKYGSFGVVMVTDVNDTMEAGDKIILN